MKAFVSLWLFIVVLFFGCRDRNADVNKETEINKSHDTLTKPARDNVSGIPPPKSDLIVSAYLIYNDGTLSTFDILNDKTVALWNVVAGGGDALKPSDSTK